MKICDFTLPEIEYLVQQGNFTEDEKELFLLRTKDVSLEACAEIMNVSTSTVNRINKKIKSKIQRLQGIV